MSYSARYGAAPTSSVSVTAVSINLRGRLCWRYSCNGYNCIRKWVGGYLRNIWHIFPTTNRYNHITRSTAGTINPMKRNVYIRIYVIACIRSNKCWSSLNYGRPLYRDNRPSRFLVDTYAPCNYSTRHFNNRTSLWCCRVLRSCNCYSSISIATIGSYCNKILLHNF